MDSSYPREATVFAALCAVVFSLLGIFGNSLTIFALISSAKLRSHATTIFIISLSVSDLIFCSFNLPLTALRYFYESWTLGETWCKIFPVFFYGNVALSLLNMIAITANRFTKVSCKFSYKKLYSTISTCIQVAIIWAISFGLMLLPLFEIWGRLGLDEETFSCTILKKDGASPKKFLFWIGIVIPFVCIAISYTCIYLKVRATKTNLLMYRQLRQLQRQRNNDRVTKLMILIFFCFVLCFIPLLLVNVYDDDVEYPTLHIFACILAWASSVVNPIIYAVNHEQYRLAYAKVLCVQDTEGQQNPFKRRPTRGGWQITSV